MFVVAGVIEMDCGLIETFADACTAVLAVLVAVTVAVAPELAVEGAV
jgi:hypothetical protein